MSVLQPVRGTHDILPDEFRAHRLVGDVASEISARFGFQEISTPIVEFSDVFKRTLGDNSDVVSKEMYTFEDKGGDQVTLRPEGTASVARMLLSGGLIQHLPLKYFYRGPMFRYERPQKGRYRQFHQIGAELLGVPDSQGDVEIIALGSMVLETLGLSGNIKLELNTLGNKESRDSYRTALIDYFERYRSDLSNDSQVRLDKNPLRILDSKNRRDRELIDTAPVFEHYLDKESKKFFAETCTRLDALSIKYEINQRLVRGLDYYSHTAFEFTTDALGAQGTVMAGGRYDGLVEQMGGAKTPGVGFAAGVERLVMLLENRPNPRRPVAIIPISEEFQELATITAYDLRRDGLVVEIAYSGNITRRLKRANRQSACAAVLLGGDELQNGLVCIRNLDSGQQVTVPFSKLPEKLKKYQ